MEQSIYENSVQIGLSVCFQNFRSSYLRRQNSAEHIFRYSALNLHISTEEEQAHRGPCFWKFNNSLLTDKTYVDLITKSIPEYVKKYQNLEDKGLLWEMIKMEIRATSIIFAKSKARKKRNEEKELLLRFNSLQEQLRLNFNETTKAEMDRVKIKLARITAIKTRGSVIRSKARWYEFGEKNSTKNHSFVFQ